MKSLRDVDCLPQVYETLSGDRFQIYRETLPDEREEVRFIPDLQYHARPKRLGNAGKDGVFVVSVDDDDQPGRNCGFRRLWSVLPPKVATNDRGRIAELDLYEIGGLARWGYANVGKRSRSAEVEFAIYPHLFGTNPVGHVLEAAEIATNLFQQKTQLVEEAFIWLR